MSLDLPAHGETNWDTKLDAALTQLDEQDTTEAAARVAGDAAAVTTAAADATTKANAAQAASTSAAATDATSKVAAEASARATAEALLAPKSSPALTGVPTAPTAAQGTNTTQIATTAFTRAEVAALVNSAPGALDTLGEIATALAADESAAAALTATVATKAPTASPTFTGTPAAPTAAPGTNTTQVATTAFVAAATGTSLASVVPQVVSLGGGYSAYAGLVTVEAGTVPSYDNTADAGWFLYPPSTPFTVDALNAPAAYGSDEAHPAGTFLAEYYAADTADAPTALPTGWTLGSVVSYTAAVAAVDVPRARQKPGVNTPNWSKSTTTYRDDLAPFLDMVSFGSSVEFPGTADVSISPGEYFCNELAAQANRLGNLNIRYENRGKNGGAVADLPADIDAYLALSGGRAPKIAVLVYGMNDGVPFFYHSGQTFAVMGTILRTQIQRLHSLGCDVILMTSPHPHSTRMDWSMAGGGFSYPNAVTLLPSDDYAGSVVTGDFAGTGEPIPASYRHVRVNDRFRQIAAETGCLLVDAETYWFAAVAALGEDALFDSSTYNEGLGNAQYVHPSETGHLHSYRAAVDDVIDALDFGSIQTARPWVMSGRVGVNTDAPQHTMDLAADGTDYNGVIHRMKCARDPVFGGINIDDGSGEPGDAYYATDFGDWVTHRDLAAGRKVYFGGGRGDGYGYMIEPSLYASGGSADHTLLASVPDADYGLLVVEAATSSARAVEAFVVIGAGPRVQIHSLGMASGHSDGTTALFSVAVSGRSVVGTPLGGDTSWSTFWIRGRTA